jgi:hypothetical protein
MALFTTNSCVIQLQALVDALWNGIADCHLYQNVVALDGNTTLGDLTEANFGGYAPVSPASWAAAAAIGTQEARSVATPCAFVCDGTAPANDIYGAYYVSGGELLAVFPLPGAPFHIANPFDAVSAKMNLHFGPRGLT